MKRWTYGILVALGAAMACRLAVVPARAQEQGSFVTISWGPTGVAGLKYDAVCNGLTGPTWTYNFENVTAHPIHFSYSFADGNAEYSHILSAHGRWTLHRVAPRFACSSNGPLQITPP